MDDAARLLGAVEAGGTKFVLALAHAGLGAEAGTAIRARHEIATRTPRETIAEMVSWFDAQTRDGSIEAFGVASFGSVDIDRGSPSYGTIGPTPKEDWEGTNWQVALENFAVPVEIDTDVNGAALAEWQAWGGSGTLAYTTVGTGIGTGVVRDGRALAGASHYEAGHVRVPHDRAADPFDGICPFHGDCLEGLASGPAIAARWGHDLSHAAAGEIAVVAGYLADYAATLVLTHMPDRLVFGGGVSKAPGLLDAVRKGVTASLGGYVPAWNGNLEQLIAGPVLGDNAGIVGALALARRALPAR